MPKVQSSVVVDNELTIADVVEEVLVNSDRPLGPSEVAQRGIEMGMFKIPRFRTKGYLTQIVQSSLHDNWRYSDNPRFRRIKPGRYAAK